MSKKVLIVVMMAALAAMAVGAGKVWAVDHYWLTAAGDTDFSNAANWGTGYAAGGGSIGAPATGDNIFIGNAGNLPATTGASACANITFDTTAGVATLACTGGTLTIDPGSTVSAIGDADDDAATLSGTVIAGGAITFNCTNVTTTNGLVISANVTGTGITLIQFTGSENILFSGNILNGGGNPVTVAMTLSSDKVTLTGTNTFAGALTLTQGELVLGSAAAEGAASAVNLNGGKLNLGFNMGGSLASNIAIGGSTEIVTTIGQTISNTITSSGAYTLTLSGLKSLELSGIIGGGTLGITINNTTAADADDNVTLSAVNTFTGVITVTDGELILSDAAAEGAASAINLNGGALNLNAAMGGSLAANIAIGGNTQIITTIVNSLSNTITSSGAYTLTLSGLKSLTLSGIIGGGTLGITVNNTTGADADDNVTLSGVNTFTGAITITDGELILTNNVAAEGTGAGGLALNGGTLTFDVAYNNNFGPAITMAGSAIIKTSTAASILNNTIDINGNTLTLQGNQNLKLSGVIGTAGDAGIIVINMAAIGQEITLSGANVYTGVTTVTQGTLNVQNNTACGTTAAGVTVAATNAKLKIQGGVTVGAETLQLSGDGGAVIEMENVSGDNTWGGAITLAAADVDFKSTSGTLTLGSTVGGAFNTAWDCNTGNVIVSGAIGAGGATTLTKTGSGTLELDGVNTYTGTTAISAGKLAGTGTIAGAVTLAAGTILAPGLTLGNAVGTMNVAGAITMTGASEYNVTVTGGATDKVVITGAVAFQTNSTGLVKIQSGYDVTGLAANPQILDFTGGGSFPNAFVETSLPASWNVDNTLSATTANKVCITAFSAAPIPTLNEWGIMIAMLLLAGAAVVFIRRRQAGMAA